MQGQALTKSTGLMHVIYRYLVLESHDGRALVPKSQEKHEPVSDIDTAVVDSLKALDLERPIREAALMHRSKQHLYSITSSARAEQRGRDSEAERLGGLEVDNETEPRRLLDGKVGWLGTFENFVNVDRAE